MSTGARSYDLELCDLVMLCPKGMTDWWFRVFASLVEGICYGNPYIRWRISNITVRKVLLHMTLCQYFVPARPMSHISTFTNLMSMVIARVRSPLRVTIRAMLLFVLGTRLRCVLCCLPDDEIRDAVYAVFSGHNEVSTREAVKKSRHMLVTKSIVRTNRI